MNKGFRVWDNQENKYFEPTYEGYKGNISEMLLSQSGELTLRTIDKFIHCPSVYPDRFETEFSTGLQDKSGVDIYEGDIVMAEVSYRVNPPKMAKAIIKFMDLSWRCDFINPYDEEDCYLLEWYSKHMEVIGNIHENKDLV